ncbi:MAG: DUF86 domain-containing protein [Chitinophagaceae bacterium]|nr:DUF86 domain-containing protein [Chitinophagaceae bacterium]MCW5904766.1 DUF86 domain-containing protein [Chitinophagaceae bacterium]
MKIDNDLFRLEHIQECIGKILELVAILHTYENFEQRWIERDAMIRNFEIIGEATHHISEELKTKYPNVAWFEIKGMRNFIAHEYFGLQLDSIWETAINDIPILQEQIKKIITNY